MKLSDRSRYIGCGILLLILLASLICYLWPAISSYGKPENLPPVDKGELSIGETTGIEIISNAREKHSYQFKGDEGTRVEIRLESISKVNFSVWVYLESDLDLVKDSSSIGPGGPVIFRVTIYKTGKYLIVVGAHDQGKYQLWLECDIDGECD